MWYTCMRVAVVVVVIPWLDCHACMCVYGCVCMCWYTRVYVSACLFVCSLSCGVCFQLLLLSLRVVFVVFVSMRVSVCVCVCLFAFFFVCCVVLLRVDRVFVFSLCSRVCSSYVAFVSLWWRCVVLLCCCFAVLVCVYLLFCSVYVVVCYMVFPVHFPVYLCIIVSLSCVVVGGVVVVVSLLFMFVLVVLVVVFHHLGCTLLVFVLCCMYIWAMCVVICDVRTCGLCVWCVCLWCGVYGRCGVVCLC